MCLVPTLRYSGSPPTTVTSHSHTDVVVPFSQMFPKSKMCFWAHFCFRGGGGSGLIGSREGHSGGLVERGWRSADPFQLPGVCLEGIKEP